MKSTHILVVDDEVLNREIIQEYLSSSGDGYEITMAVDGIEAMEILETNPEKYDAVLLDRMMPRMTGMEVLEKITSHPQLKYIPVILQTAKVSREDIMEGMQAGAFYYLTKPFTRGMLVSVVGTAVKDRNYNKALLKNLNETRYSVKMLESASFRFRNLDDVNSISTLVACTTDEPEKVAMGLAELMVNAIEHGNLNIGYDQKSNLRANDEWEQEIKKRLSSPEYKDRYASLVVDNTPDKVIFTITDQGDGFKWDEFMEFDTARVMDNHGRGIAMANNLYFSSLEYQGKGNVVTVSVKK